MKTLLITGFEPFGGETINPGMGGREGPAGADRQLAAPEAADPDRLRPCGCKNARLRGGVPPGMPFCASGRRERAAP